MAILELRKKEFCLRFRAIPEDSFETIREKPVRALTDLLSWKEEQMEGDLEKVYCINYSFVAMTQIARYILVHFLKKRIRDQVLQCYFEARLKIDNGDVIVLKEISITILCKKEDYFFLTDILKRRRIPFHWHKLEGVIFTFEPQRYRLSKKLTIF